VRSTTTSNLGDSLILSSFGQREGADIIGKDPERGTGEYNIWETLPCEVAQPIGLTIEKMCSRVPSG
jgi:hypothetical protein